MLSVVILGHLVLHVLGTILLSSLELGLAPLLVVVRRLAPSPARCRVAVESRPTVLILLDELSPVGGTRGN